MILCSFFFFLKESLYWIELTKLYRSLNDFDSIKGIFLKNKNLISNSTRLGFINESNMNYHSAYSFFVESYNSCLNDNDNNIDKKKQVELEFLEESILRCCNELNDWNKMNNQATKDNSLLLIDLFNDNDSRKPEIIFPFAFRSSLKLILQSKDVNQQNKFKKFLASLDANGRQYLEENFCQEMALYCIFNEDFDLAKHYGYKTKEKYLIVNIYFNLIFFVK